MRFDEEGFAERLTRRKDELTRMAALKEQMIAEINSADPPLTKADLKIRGFGGQLTGADQQAITGLMDARTMGQRNNRQWLTGWHCVGMTGFSVQRLGSTSGVRPL